MKLVEGAVDYGAPEFVATGTAEIDRFSPGQIRISYYSHRGGEDVIVCHVVWDAEAFERVQAGYRKFRMTENRDKFAEVS